MQIHSNPIPQIKICGLTNAEQALGCVAAGADAIGLVFYEKSPRNVTEEQARAICDALPEKVPGVGVFVNESFEFIMGKVKTCGLKAAQLHGQEGPEMVARLRESGLIVIKGLYVNKAPLLKEADDFDASGFLVECGKGKLPGGNAMTWNWGEVRGFGEDHPMILAGGLAPDNIAQAIDASQPDAVDISSGVESSPGQKDLDKVRAFMDGVLQSNLRREPRRIF
ncbi:phosphoribosylanthranilate isomerase [Desulfonema ishimotonii]|uniref:N-(5'-phosphoribosyl)anthranilate isomerase n=1 Tax=Desulfonema ishimotonii TaxID=45657 RepID=A0A401FU96_9BACT|nr:phosphoribosylanthranilate isomerase [Desulfonema ishimotonii]GBC60530.1 phosphoribosylanthranilate isomerase [Desulfonema ishimotonii]